MKNPFDMNKDGKLDPIEMALFYEVVVKENEEKEIEEYEDDENVVDTYVSTPPSNARHMDEPLGKKWLDILIILLLNIVVWGSIYIVVVYGNFIPALIAVPVTLYVAKKRGL